MFESGREAFQANGTSFTARSTVSGPWITEKTSAQSSALRHIGPILSIVQVSAMPPVRATRPKVGRKPEIPQTVAGDVIDPLVSVPMPKGTQPAAVADADPAEEPLEPLAGSHGLRVRSPYQMSPC